MEPGEQPVAEGNLSQDPTSSDTEGGSRGFSSLRPISGEWKAAASSSDTEVKKAGQGNWNLSPTLLVAFLKGQKGWRQTEPDTRPCPTDQTPPLPHSAAPPTRKSHWCSVSGCGHLL